MFVMYINITKSCLSSEPSQTWALRIKLFGCTKLKTTLTIQIITKCPENRKKMSCLYAQNRFLKKNCSYQVWNFNIEQQTPKTTQKSISHSKFKNPQIFTEFPQTTSSTIRTINHKLLIALDKFSYRQNIVIWCESNFACNFVESCTKPLLYNTKRFSSPTPITVRIFRSIISQWV